MSTGEAEQTVGPARLMAAGKRVAPHAARVVPPGLSRLASIYLDVLQGKGSGTGWDLRSESAADVTVLRGVADPVVVNGGANFGQWATECDATLGNANARFFLIEPQQACQSRLRALRIPNATIIQAALGAQAGAGVLSGAAPGYGAASLYERHDTYFGDMSAHQETVSVRTLDDILDEHALPRVDLLKLDVEGAELAALEGGTRSLEEGVVRAVAFEFGSANIFSRTFFRDFWELLTPLGFEVARVLPGGRLLPIERYSEEHEHFRGVSNYLARRG